MTAVIESPPEMRAWATEMRANSRTIALVPTMGALHRGHLDLIDTAGRHADTVVVSVFVNPLQFGEQNDFDRYPRPIDDDLHACEQHGAAVVYVPTAAAMYPHGFATTVHVAGLTDLMEGASRPGHFDGVTTVVAKLLAASRPHIAVFGEKDYQQLAVVRRMVSDLDLGVEILAHPIVREHDGLAFSSRNRRLTDKQRCAAVCMPNALAAATRCAESGDVGEVIAAATAIIDGEPGAELDYVAVFDTATLEPVCHLDGERRRPGRVRVAIAARFGDVRLIDNADPFAP